MIADVPDEIKQKLTLSQYNLFYPSTYLPTPSESDYMNGFITRHFIGKQNQNIIIETNLRDYKMTDGNFFIKAQCNWRLTGPKNNVYSGTMLQTFGVSEQNKIQIDRLKKTLPGVENILTNPLQFWTESPPS
jgi:hypothetical protein